MSPESLETPDRLVDAVKKFAVSHGLVQRGDHVLAAVSGGADSMALLSILHRLSGDLGFTLAAGHFNHQLRESAHDELERVREYAVSLALPFHWGTEDVRALVESTGDSVEEAARKARYGFLHRTAASIQADRIATGHTRTDHVETILMRIIRGTGIRGLAGIPVRRGGIVRPLLGVSREETVSYCRTLGISYVEDASNDDPRFFRNRVRLELLPLLGSKYHPGVQENLVHLAENARRLLDRIREETTPLIRRSLTRAGPDRWVLDTSAIAHLDGTAIVVFFGDVFADELSCDMDFTRIHYGELERLVRDPLASGKTLSLPGLTVKKEYETLIITRPTGVNGEDLPLVKPMVLTLPGETLAPGLVVTTEVLDRSGLGGFSFAAAEREAYFDLGRLTPPLVLRAPSPGDRMQPFGMTGTKKLSDIFSDGKIPASSRTTSLVIADTHDILWLVGVATSEKCRIGPGTRQVIKIRVEKREHREN